MRVEDRVLLVSSHCHVGGINNIFTALLNGAAVYPFNLKEIELATLADWIIDREITIYHSVPTIFRHFINSLTDRHNFPKLRLIHIGGESVFKRDYDLYKKHFTADCILVNSIGCTEISGYRHFSLDRSSQITTNIIPVGYAAEDTEVLLCDDRGMPVGNNTIGEIVVKSEYLALGYWQRPDLDARVFMPDPNGGKQRLYRTGDLGQMSPDGCLMHLGRKDAQIKIRGYRVELGECEAVLSEHPSVKEVVVIAQYSQEEMAQADRNIEQSSIAYIVPNSAENISERSLFEFLQNKLPSYLIPSVFIFTDVLPLNANNKIDRLALPSPNLTAKIITQEYIPARNEIEAQLVAIWTKVLDLERVSIYENFFALGGHSLLAVRLFAEIGKTWGQTLPLTTLFEHQTIAELAVIIDRSSTEGDRSWPSLITIDQRPSSQPPLFCIHDVSGDLLFYRKLIEHLAVDRSCYGIQPRGLDGKQAPTATIPAMATDYLNQILKVQPIGPYYLAGFSFGGLIAFEIARQLHALGQETALLAILDTIAPVFSDLDPVADRILPQTGLQVKFNWVNKFMRFDRADRINYLRNGIRRHTLSKLRIPHRLYLRYIKRSLPALGRLDVYWTNYRAMRSYVVRSTYPGKVVLFCSGEKLPALATTPQLNWERVATGVIEVHVVPKTNHLTMIQEPHVRVLATQLTRSLASSCDAQIDVALHLYSSDEAGNSWQPDLQRQETDRVQPVRLSLPNSL
jgi:thioesterase domain-containing protein